MNNQNLKLPHSLLFRAIRADARKFGGLAHMGQCLGKNGPEFEAKFDPDNQDAEPTAIELVNAIALAESNLAIAYLADLAGIDPRGISFRPEEIDVTPLRQDLAETNLPANRVIVQSAELQSQQTLDHESSVDGIASAADTSDGKEGGTLRARRIAFLVATATALGYDPMAIPTGGKQIIKNACLSLPSLFTEASFDHAWKAAGGHVRMADHAHFARRE